MGQFVYLLPGKGPAKALVEKYGLASRIGPEPPPRGLPDGVGVKDGKLCRVKEGPDEEMEAVIVGLGKKLGFFPEQQTWERVELPGVEPHWIGWFTDDGPGPEELARKALINGHMVKLADGKEWLVPIARSYMPGTCLPEKLRMGPDGQLEHEIRDDYRELFDRAGAFAEAMYSEMKVDMEEADSFRLAVDALAVNYRVGIAEINALGLLDTSARHAVLWALVDGPRFEEFAEQVMADAADQKKKDPSE